MSGMKKIILAGLSTMLLAACTDNDVLENQQVDPASTFTRYITVSLATNEASTTRDGETYISAQNGENIGIADEYGVGTTADGKDDVLFYLFNSDGSAYTGTSDGVNGMTYDIVSDIYETDGWQTNDHKREKKYIVKLFLKDGQQSAPAKIVAIVNPSGAKFTPASTLSLDALRKTYLTGSANYSAANKFLMSNSVYVDNSGKTGKNVYATDITEANCAETPELATQNPINIYVERVVSKVMLDADKTVLGSYDVTMEKTYYEKYCAVNEAKLPTGYTSTSYKTTDDGKYYTNAIRMSDGTLSQPLTVEITGWNLFNTFPSTMLEKNIDTGMPTNWVWNASAKFRSYWSTTALASGESLAERTLKWTEMKANGKETVEYPFENTLAYDKAADNNTSILFAATIKAGGSAISMFSYRGAYYEKDKLKEQWAGLLKSIYTDEDCKKSVTASDIKLLVDKTDGYHVTPYLKIVAVDATNDVTAVNYYHKVGDVIKTYTQEELNAEVEQLGKAQLWNGGHCYYFTEIMHPQYKYQTTDALSNTSSYVQTGDIQGIVRNHWYNMSINSIVGLGTPVPQSDDEDDPEIEYPDPDNPDPGVDPTRPEDDPDNYWYLDVKCIIQPWQLVNNGLNMISKDGETATTPDNGSGNSGDQTGNSGDQTGNETPAQE
jgi:hypothetical protein